jgi:endogenous inhibitor of DNA gyrase (YacG/DUF329 family)
MKPPKVHCPICGRQMKPSKTNPLAMICGRKECGK